MKNKLTLTILGVLVVAGLVFAWKFPVTVQNFFSGQSGGELSPVVTETTDIRETKTQVEESIAPELADESGAMTDTTIEVEDEVTELEPSMEATEIATPEGVTTRTVMVAGG